ncbi:protein of unknown function [Desulfocicer vacuolatum DSM 3385]|uniref:DUF4381 domain-containing protein n=1 Tax=Desulfocicer vacuolatum DSM 3385 TaxID=1121400 RepID=A0A1W1ZGU0_9BACT|nr:DUF4381 domain-containing protein [Desulfocicer vacuolatum]SMC47730.1 protein of unknown function [Desulfocicer vacuolatum DSM 3385]
MHDIHDIEPPIPIGMDPIYIQILLGLAVILLVAGMGLLLFFYLKHRKQKKIIADTLLLPPPLPPDQAAIKALDALADLMKTDPRRYYFEISAVLKTFMGKVFDMGAPEMTTREVVSSLSGLNLDRNLTARTRDFFHFAAMVKYAGITPEIKRIHEDHDLVREFIHFTTGGTMDSDSGAETAPVKGISTNNNPATARGEQAGDLLSPGPDDHPSHIGKGH